MILLWPYHSPEFVLVSNVVVFIQKKELPNAQFVIIQVVRQLKIRLINNYKQVIWWKPDIQILGGIFRKFLILSLTQNLKLDWLFIDVISMISAKSNNYPSFWRNNDHNWNDCTWIAFYDRTRYHDCISSLRIKRAGNPENSVALP